MTSKISAGGGNRLPRLHLTAVKYTAQFAIPTTVQEAAQTLSPAIQDQPQANMVPGRITITTPGKVVRMDPSDPRHLTLSSYSRVMERTTAALRFTSCMFLTTTSLWTDSLHQSTKLHWVLLSTLRYRRHKDRLQGLLCKS